VLAWWRYLWGQPGALAGLGLLALMLVAARLSQVWVEDPARRHAGTFAQTCTRFLLLPLLLLGTLALLMARGAQWGLPLYPQAQQQAWAALARDSAPPHRQDWVCQRHRLQAADLADPKCQWGAAKAEWLLLGDSFAGQYAPMLRPLAEAAGVGMRSVALGACAPLPGPLRGVVGDDRLDACEQGVPRILEAAARHPRLMLGANWAQYQANEPRTLERLEAWLRERVAAGQQVVLLLSVPVLQGYDADCLAKRQRVGSLLECPLELPADPKAAAFNERLVALARRLPGVSTLDVGPRLCPGRRLCPLTDAQGRPLYSDPKHLSVHGGATLAAELLAQGDNPLVPRD
jgi:hypothetical protein